MREWFIFGVALALGTLFIAGGSSLQGLAIGVVGALLTYLVERAIDRIGRGPEPPGEGDR